MGQPSMRSAILMIETTTNRMMAATISSLITHVATIMIRQTTKTMHAAADNIIFVRLMRRTAQTLTATAVNITDVAVINVAKSIV